MTLQQRLNQTQKPVQQGGLLARIFKTAPRVLPKDPKPLHTRLQASQKGNQ